jgi:hypothetical protein
VPPATVRPRAVEEQTPQPDEAGPIVDRNGELEPTGS